MLANKYHILAIVLFCISFASCTSARWSVKEKSAVDESDYKVLQQDNFLMKAGEVTPDNPVLTLEMYSKTKVEYTERVLMQRTIQDYKLRPGFLALGLGGAAMAFYLANSDAIRDNSGTSVKSLTLNGVGALMAISGFLNMKPMGDPRPTGEERFLRRTGSIVQVDTVKVPEDSTAMASVIVEHNDRVIFEERRDFSTGSVEVTLANKLNELQLSGSNPGSVSVDISFEDSVYNFDYDVEQILKPYAEVTSQLTELRNSPEESQDNILADLVKGSQLKIESAKDEDWYQVLYGISENYVRKEDAELIWRSSDFIQEEQVVTVPRVPFGNIDVESNIPILRGPTSNAVALIVTNENYLRDLSERNYALRDGRLMKVYLKNALGYSDQKIFELTDFKTSDQLYSKLSELKTVTNDSTELFVYLSGHGAINLDGDGSRLEFLGISQRGNPRPSILFQKLFGELSSIPSNKMLVLADIDFSSDVNAKQFTSADARQVVETNAAALINQNPNAALLMSTRLMNPSSLYVSAEGEDKKHHIFPYFFAKALQERKTTISEIYQYLERNIAYTARRLFDRPQDPLLIGNTSLDLVTE